MNNRSAAIVRNNKISELGRQRKWKDMLRLYEEKKDEFNDVNYSTMMSQLGRMSRDVDRRDILFVNFMEDLSFYIEKREIKSMQVRSVANIIHAIGKMKLRCKWSKQIMGLVSEEESAERIVEKGNIQEITNIAWAFATLGMKSPTLFAKIEDHAEWLVTEGNCQDVANIAWAVATLGITSPTLFDRIEKCAEWLVEEATTQEISNTAWAFAKLGIDSPDLFAEIEKRAAWLIGTGNTQDAANTAWASSTLGVKSPKLFAEIEKRAAWLVREGNTQHISNTVWAFASIGFQSPKLFAEIENRAEWLVQETGSRQDISNTAWAFATAGIKSPKLFAEIDKRARWLVKEGGILEASNTSWAYAKLGIQSPTLFVEIENQAERIVNRGEPQHVANIAWAFATLGIKSHKFFTVIEKRAEWLVKEGNAQNIANTAWAFATLNIDSPNLFTYIEKRAEWFVKNGALQTIANTLWAASKFRYHVPNLAAEVDGHGKFIVEDGNAQNITNIALAFATVGYKASTFFTALEDNIEKVSTDEILQSSCNTCYSLVILDLGKKHERLLSDVWTKLMNANPKDFLNSELCQLVVVEAFSKLDGIKLLKPSRNLRAKMNTVVWDTNQSKWQKQISSLLTAMGFIHDEEVPPLIDSEIGDMMSIDMACPERRIAIECDGPTHYLVLPNGDNTNKQNGPTIAKKRFLQKNGWATISLDYRKHMECTRKVETVKWLRDELANVGVYVDDSNIVFDEKCDNDEECEEMSETKLTGNTSKDVLYTKSVLSRKRQPSSKKKRGTATKQRGLNSNSCSMFHLLGDDEEENESLSEGETSLPDPSIVNDTADKERKVAVKTLQSNNGSTNDVLPAESSSSIVKAPSSKKKRKRKRSHTTKKQSKGMMNSGSLPMSSSEEQRGDNKIDRIAMLVGLILVLFYFIGSGNILSVYQDIFKKAFVAK